MDKHDDVRDAGERRGTLEISEIEKLGMKRTGRFVYAYIGDEPADFEIPVKEEACWGCRGKGSRVNPSIDGNGLSWERLEDSEFKESYLSGVYDVSCTECGGRGTVFLEDLNKLTEPQRAAVQEWFDDEEESALIMAAEKAMGA